ncbi:hypothetical protein J4467_00290 [Candidatus Woesearchaeota archaeon]|nr:hypothetical protein [Candidatus Woesearchaeota archaeon]
MKYFLLLLVIFSFASVSAEDFGAGETVQVYVDDSFSSSDVKLYYNYTDVVSINSIVKEISDTNILYFDLPINCSLGTYYLDYSVGNLTFVVVDSSSVMRISPVYHIFDKTKSSFYLELTSVKGDFDVVVNATNAEPRKSLVSLTEGSTKNLYIDYVDTSSFGSVQLSYENFSYNINLFPVDIEPVVNQTEDIVVNETEDVVIVPEEKVPLTFLVTNPEATISLGVNQSVVATLKVQNTFGEKLEGLSYSVTGDIVDIVSFKSEEISMEADEIIETEFLFNPNEDAFAGAYTGEIVFGNSDYEISLLVVVIISADAEETSTEGVVLGDDIIFEGQILEEKKSNTVLIVGIVLVVLMLFLIAVVVLKLRQTPEKRFNQYIEETKKKK